jgi:cytochrome c oxidase assembly protein subunit 15
MIKQGNKNAIITWLLSGCFFIYVMVVVGGITRLTHSGLSMVEWKPVTGALPPMNSSDWNDLFEKYKQSPEYKEINTQFTVEDFKSIFWWEFIHRLIGRFIGVLFFIPFVYFLIRRKLSTDVLWNCILIMVMGGFQGVLGWYMVKSGLVKNPNVSHYRLAAHLISAFAVFGLTFNLVLKLYFGGENSLSKAVPKLKWPAIILFILVIFQIIYGAFTAGLKAGYAYNTYPKMNGEWLPIRDLILQPFYKNFLENPAGVQFIHRWLAGLVILLVAYIWWKSRNLVLGYYQKLSINLLVFCVLIQFLLGLLTLLYAVPAVLGVLHQTGAFFLFSACIFFIFQIKQGTKIAS